ncbi:hypothetical protein M0805_002614 [Coniferiporia weirii]|nr:hypothetical protein M0805_002614 [Coniferiporia weirii]
MNHCDVPASVTHSGSETDATLVDQVVDPSDRSERFWFYDGSLTIRVERMLYKVHESLLLAHWPIFCECLIPDDESVFIPIVNISKADFELLLDFIYPTSCVPNPDSPRSTDDWMRALAASALFEFDAPRRAAIAALAPVLSPVARIRLAREHGLSMDEWRLPSLRELCERAEPLKLEEARELELTDVLSISRAREMLARGTEWTKVNDLFD